MTTKVPTCMVCGKEVRPTGDMFVQGYAVRCENGHGMTITMIKRGLIRSKWMPKVTSFSENYDDLARFSCEFSKSESDRAFESLFASEKSKMIERVLKEHNDYNKKIPDS